MAQHTTRSDRAQTAIDFVVAMGVFFIAVAFVLAFVPSMFAPFFGMGASDALVTDRSAAHLANNALVADSNTPGTLDEGAVEDLFRDCDEEVLRSELAITNAQISVVIEDATQTPLEVNGTETACGSDRAAVETTSNRIVMIGDEQGTLRVGV